MSSYVFDPTHTIQVIFAIFTFWTQVESNFGRYIGTVAEEISRLSPTDRTTSVSYWCAVDISDKTPTVYAPSAIFPLARKQFWQL